MWKTLDKLEQLYLIGYKTKIYMTIEDFNNMLTDERIHKNSALNLTDSSAEIVETGVYGRYKDMIEIHIFKNNQIGL